MPKRSSQPPRHPKTARLQAFFLAQVNAEERSGILRHLLAGCEPCREKVRGWDRVSASLPPTFARRGPSDAYDFVLRKAGRFAAAVDRARKEALRGIEPLLAPNRAVANSHPVIAWARALARLERARALRRADPADYELAAGWALHSAQALPTGALDPQDHADHLARAWAEMGNAHRKRHESARAEQAFEAAMASAALGRCAPALLAELLDLSSSLWADLQRFDEAERQITLADRLYRAAGDLRSAGRACMTLGRFRLDRGEPADAVRCYCRAFDQFGPAREPVLWATALFNILTGLTDLGQHDAAEKFYRPLAPLIERHVQADDRIRLLWLSGRIDLGTGRYHKAELSLRTARRQFEAFDLPFLAALAALDLCQVWLHTRRTGEVRAAVEEILLQFTTRGIAREALAALLLLEQAARQERATVVLLREAARAVVSIERGGR